MGAGAGDEAALTTALMAVTYALIVCVLLGAWNGFLVSVLGIQFIALFGGSVIIENLFALPGLGQASQAAATASFGACNAGQTFAAPNPPPVVTSTTPTAPIWGCREKPASR